MSFVNIKDFLNTILHGNDGHRQWLTDEFIKAFGPDLGTFHKVEHINHVCEHPDCKGFKALRKRPVPQDQIDRFNKIVEDDDRHERANSPKEEE